MARIRAAIGSWHGPATAAHRRIGSPGSGKSTLATALARATGLPLIHLDREYWQAGWREPPEGEWLGRHGDLVGADAWIIDGNYGSSLSARLARTTLVVWLDLPTRSCLAGALRRIWRHRRGSRPDMAADCPERYDAAFAKFLLYIAAFRRQRRPAVAARLSESGLPVVRITSRRQQGAFLRHLAASGLAAAMASPS